MGRAEAAEWAIQADRLTKSYGKTVAVDGIDLALGPACVFGLLGANGAGKTSLLKVLAGVSAPTAGRALVLGCDVVRERHKIRERIGYVPERHFIYPWMRVREVIRFASAFYPTWNQEFAARLAEMFALDLRKRVKHLSHGMLAKLALLIATAHEPKVLLLDEPTSGLDPLIRAEFLDRLRELPQAAGQTVVISSHLVNDLERVADTVGIMAGGRLVAVSSVTELLERTKRIRIRLTSNAGPFVPPANFVWKRCVERDLVVVVSDWTQEVTDAVRRANDCERIDVEPMNLEDIFLAHMRGLKEGP